MKCFMYRFLITNSVVDISTLFSSSVSSFTCLVSTCPSTCSTAFIFDSKPYCIASNSNQSSSGNNSLCACASGCSNVINCLNPLTCAFNSTYFNGTSLYCICGNSGTTTSCFKVKMLSVFHILNIE